MKKLLVLSLVLLLGVTCMAKTNYFDDLYIGGDVTVVGTVTFTDIDIVGDLGLTGNADFDGATMLFDGSTSVRNVSAAFTSLEAPANRIGVSATIYTSFAATAVTGVTAITMTGNAPTVTWTANSFDWVGSTALDDTLISTTLGIGTDITTNGTTGTHDWFLTDSVVDALSIQRGTTDFIVLDTSTVSVDITGDLDANGALMVLDGSTSFRGISAAFTSLESPANRFGLNATEYTQFATAVTTGITAVTMTGNAPTLTWTANSFDWVGSTALDDTLISTTLGIGTDLSMVGTTGTHDLFLTDSVADALSIQRGSTDMIVFNTSTPLITITPNTSIVGDLAVDGTSNLDDVDIDGTVDVASFFNMGTMDAGIAVTTSDPFTVEVHTEPLTTLTAGATGYTAGIRSRYHVSVAQPNQISIAAVESRLRVKHALADGVHSAVSAVIEASGTDADFTGTATTQRSAGFFALDFDADVTLADDGWLTGVTINSSVNGSVSMAATKFVGLLISTNAGSEVWESDIELQGGATFVNSTDTTLTIAETNIGLTGDVVVTGSLSSTVPKSYDALLSSTEVDVNAVTTTALYTVPTGTSCVITRIVIRSANKSLDQATDATSNIGFDAATDLVTSADITKVLTGTSTWDLLTLVTPGVMGTTTQVLNWHNTTGCTTADSTLQVDVFGYLF